MKVCVWTDSDCFAGTERHCLDLAAGLRERGVHVLVANRTGSPLQRRALEMGLEVVSLDVARHPLTCLAMVQNLFDSGRVDVFHTHNGVTTAIGAAARRWGGRGALVATQHFIQPARALRRGPVARVFGRLQRWHERSVNRWVAISRAVRDAMLARGDVEGRRIALVPNGIRGPLPGEKERDVARAAFGWEPSDWVMVCPARLDPEKGHLTLLHACALLKTEGVAFRLFCIGAGTLGKALEMRVRELGLEEHVCFAGYQSAVEEWVRAADLVVLPSPEEPFGLVLLEAMSRGVAVIAANAGGPSEILENGAGMTFKPEDPRDLARKLWRVKEDPHLCEALARAGQERWSEKFTTARMVDGLLEAYEVSVREAGLVS